VPLSAPHYKYGYASYATYVGPTSAATIALGSTEASARKQVSDAKLPSWNANWKVCTEMWVPSGGRGASTPCSTATYGSHANNSDVITYASGYQTIGVGFNPSIPNNYLSDNVYEFGWQAQGIYGTANDSERGKGYSDGAVYIRRVTK
jgi:hypothetical protein